MTHGAAGLAPIEVLVAGMSTGSGGGQDVYERDLIAALSRSTELRLGADRVGLSARTIARRAMSGRLLRFSRVLRRPLGPFTWDHRVVHRLDLRLPPGRVDIVTIHDVAPMLFSDEARIPATVWQEARRADAVITATQFAAEEIRRVLGLAAPIVIPHGVPSDVHDSLPLDTAGLRQLGITAPYVLQVGGGTRRKNLPLLREAWLASDARRDGVMLVSCGPMRAGRQSQLGGGGSGVLILDVLPRNVVLRLMRSASAVVVPSIYEGFGLPLVEAMAMGTPVVAARTPSAVEVCGDAAILVDPDPDSLAAGIDRALSVRDTVARETMKARSRLFTWERAASSHAEIYRGFVK